MPYKEDPVLSYIQYAITGYFGMDVAIDCPEKLLKSYQKELAEPTRFPMPTKTLPMTVLSFIQQPEMPSIYSAMAFPLIVLILFLNRKKYIESFGIRMFTNFYFTILGISCLLCISEVVYKYIWIFIYRSRVICTLVTMEWSDYGPPKHSKIEPPLTQDWGKFNSYTYPRVYQWLDEILYFFEKWARHIFPLLLILHRITTYWACARAFTFKKWFSQKRLRFYYWATVIISLILIYCKRFYFWTFYNGKIETLVEISFLILETLIHVLITTLSVFSVVTHRYKQNSAMKELKYFLYFSIFPTLASTFLVFFQMFCGKGVLPGEFYVIGTSRTSVVYGFGFFGTASQCLSILLSDSKPLYDCILLFACIPNYRKTFFRVVLRFKDAAVVPIVSRSHSHR